jgi:DNA topoisomerase-6 subunit A
MSEKASKSSINLKKNLVSGSFKKLGASVYNQMADGKFPSIIMPNRSVTNIKYDAKLRQFVLGNKKIQRSARNMRHIKALTQLIWIAYIAHQLGEESKTSTLRDVYYMAQAFDVAFKDQFESDKTVTDLESIVEYAREDFNIFPEERSAIYGNLTVEYTVPGYEGQRLNLNIHPDGVMIGPALTSADFIETVADKIICIEKGAMFTRLIEEKAWKKFNAILIHTAGQPPRATRCLIRRLNQELGLPVYIFTDADPWGISISWTIIYGSANAAHIKELATPDAHWMGVFSTDISKYHLPSIRLNEIDVKKLYDMQKDPRSEGALWKEQINSFVKNKAKCELEAFSRYGLSFVTDKYLPERLGKL